MTKVQHYIVSAPLELPAIPDKFQLAHIEAGNDEYKSDLKAAAFKWFESGHVDNALRVVCESDVIPVDGGTYVIYSDWDEFHECWGDWLDYFYSDKIDFDKVYSSFRVEVQA